MKPNAILLLFCFAQLVSKNPIEANLSQCSLEKIPKYLFLNTELVALNLSRNFMKESCELEVTQHSLPQGWISDLHNFPNLRVLSLSDNNLQYFPQSVCGIATLSELDLSCNFIRTLSEDIKSLKK